MKQESSTNTPEQEDHIRGNTKVEPSCPIEYQGDSKKRSIFYRIVSIVEIVYLKGERIISSMNVRIPKCVVPILAAMKKKIVTNTIEIKINIQDVRSNSFKRFQVGATLAGYLENQYSGK